jgi:hypothetical protein
MTGDRSGSDHRRNPDVADSGLVLVPRLAVLTWSLTKLRDFLRENGIVDIRR